MANSHGRNADFRMDNAAGTLTDITAYVHEVSWPEELEPGETTAMGDNSKTYIAGLKDSTCSVSVRFDPAINTIVTAVLAAQSDGSVASVSLQYSPAGTGSGAPKKTAEAIVTNWETSSSVSDPNEATIEFQITGDVTNDTH